MDNMDECEKRENKKENTWKIDFIGMMSFDRIFNIGDRNAFYKIVFEKKP
jgi:hypothetical protein